MAFGDGVTRCTTPVVSADRVLPIERLLLLAIVAVFTAGCEQPVESMCRCLPDELDAPAGEVQVMLTAYGDAIEAPTEPTWHPAHYRIDLDPGFMAQDDPRVFPEAQVAGLMEIDVYQNGEDWLRLYLPQDDARSPVGDRDVDQTDLTSPFIGGAIGGETFVIDDVDVTLDARIDTQRVYGTFVTYADGFELSGVFEGESRALCKPADADERVEADEAGGWHQAPFDRAPSCLTVADRLWD